MSKRSTKLYLRRASTNVDYWEPIALSVAHMLSEPCAPDSAMATVNAALSTGGSVSAVNALAAAEMLGYVRFNFGMWARTALGCRRMAESQEAAIAPLEPPVRRHTAFLARNGAPRQAGA